MPQIVIDPDAHGFPNERANLNLVSPVLRNFGYVPDVRECRPGDLILSCSRVPSLFDRMIESGIVSAQRGFGFADEHARWTHAAVFLYQDFVVEAVPFRGVIARSLYKDIPGSILRVRRDLTLSDHERYKIALSALRMLSARYSFGVAFSAALQAFAGEWNRSWFSTERRAVVCSRVYFDAYSDITRKLLSDCQSGELITPAHLSATTDLTDVNIPWLRIDS